MLNEALRLIRKFHGIKQSTLATELSISKSYLSEIEKGIKNPTIELLDKYSERFDMPTSSLLLFAEKLESKTHAENVRIKAAKKIIKLMKWITNEK